MAYTETIQQLNDARRRILEIRAEMRELQAGIEPEPVEDYEFGDAVDGPAAAVAVVRRPRRADPDPQHGIELRLLHAVGRRIQRPRRSPRGSGRVRRLTSPESPEDQRKFADKPGLALPDGQPRRHEFARRHGLLHRRWRLLRVSSPECRYSERRRAGAAGIRRQLGPERRLLHGLAPVQPVPGGPQTAGHRSIEY